jgi:hypothetical protein
MTLALLMYVAYIPFFIWIIYEIVDDKDNMQLSKNRKRLY